MDEMSRMIIEEYCMFRNTKKAQFLKRLVEKSYDYSYQLSDSEAMYLGQLISREKDSELRKALRDLDNFMTGY